MCNSIFTYIWFDSMHASQHGISHIHCTRIACLIIGSNSCPGSVLVPWRGGCKQASGADVRCCTAQAQQKLIQSSSATCRGSTHTGVRSWEQASCVPLYIPRPGLHTVLYQPLGATKLASRRYHRWPPAYC
jgi:hypothetical protein